jgi:hypothetical protein
MDQIKVKVTLRLKVSQSASFGVHLRLKNQIFITVWQSLSYSCGAPFLTRGRVCLLYMLLVLASAVFLGSESLGTRDHILLSQIWDFLFRRLLRLAGSRWRYSTPSQHGLVCPNYLPYNHFELTEQNTTFPIVTLLLCAHLLPRERVCLEKGCIIPLFIFLLRGNGCPCYSTFVRWRHSLPNIF